MLRQRDRLLDGPHAASAHAHVHLDQDLEPAPGGLDRAVEVVAVPRIIHRHGQAALPAGQAPGPRILSLPQT